jgi:hypothetical protein
MLNLICFLIFGSVLFFLKIRREHVSGFPPSGSHSHVIRIRRIVVVPLLRWQTSWDNAWFCYGTAMLPSREAECEEFKPCHEPVKSNWHPAAQIQQFPCITSWRSACLIPTPHLSKILVPMVTMQFLKMQFWKGQYDDKQSTLQRFNGRAWEVKFTEVFGLLFFITVLFPKTR